MSKTEVSEEFNTFHCFKQNIQNRMLKNNQNWMAVIVGGTGSGKSWSALSLADELSPNGFDMRNMAFTPQEIIKVINSGRLKKGDIIIADELGVSMSSKDWYSIQNKFLNYLFQTFREMNIGFIATVPAIKFIDNSMRILFHNRFETQRIHRRSGLVELNIYDLVYSNMRDKLYTISPVYRDDDGLEYKMPKVFIKQPREELIKGYEEKSKKYKARIRKEVEARLDRADDSRDVLASCKVCGRSGYRYTSSKHIWTCRTCGEVYHENPYKVKNGN